MFHPSFYSHTQQGSSLRNNHVPNYFFNPAHFSVHRRSRRSNRIHQNLNFTRNFQQFAMPPYGFYDLSRWKQYRRTGPTAFQFQDKSTFYYMSEPMIMNDNRISIQLTKVSIGANGDQQRVFVEQEFSNEYELKKFIKNLKSNFEKTFHNQNMNQKKSNVIVVEEPDEEPKIYEQKTYDETTKVPQLTFVPSSSTVHVDQSKSSYYQTPPKFQKEKPSSSVFHRYHGRSRSRFARLKEQPYGQYHRSQQQQQRQPRKIAENFIFRNNQQSRVDRSRSECQTKIFYRYKIPPYMYARQRYFIPFILPYNRNNNGIQSRSFNLFY